MYVNGQIRNAKRTHNYAEPMNLPIEISVLDFLDKEEEDGSFTKEEIINKILYCILELDDEMRMSLAYEFVKKSCYALMEFNRFCVSGIDYRLEREDVKDSDVLWTRAASLMETARRYMNLYDAFGGYKYFGPRFQEMWSFDHISPHVTFLQNGFIVSNPKVEIIDDLIKYGKKAYNYVWDDDNNRIVLIGENTTKEELSELFDFDVSDEKLKYFREHQFCPFGSDNFKVFGISLPFIHFQDLSIK